MLKELLDKRKDLRHHLFTRGFLITENDISFKENEYPFYSNWKQQKISSYFLWTHPLQKLYIFLENNQTYFLIGHAYNPFTMDHDENIILQKLAASKQEGKEVFFNCLNELSGLFIFGILDDDGIKFTLDCSGMQYGCYGLVTDKLYIASHMQLIGDICDLSTDPFVEKLIQYKWYKFMMGNYLPGDLTAFNEIKRIIPNTWVTRKQKSKTFEIHRFYPDKPIQMCSTEKEYQSIISEASKILKKNMELITKKWSKPAISLTGGIDSNTTFSAANGLYDKFSAFSYISMYRESVDAAAARKIATAFNVKNQTYQIPDNNDQIKDFELYKKILSHNDGDIGPTKDNDTRKKITLMQNNVCEIEVKSWIAETVRAYAYKYFGRTKMPKVLKPRHYTSLYKIFFLNRALVHATDRYFAEYLKKTNLKKHLFNYDESDFFVWEMMHGGKCGLNIGTMKFCFDITIPYNNRKLLDLLLRIDLKDRISDRHMLDLKKTMNKALYDMNIRVINLNETKNRKRLANFYFSINTRLPF